MQSVNLDHVLSIKYLLLPDNTLMMNNMRGQGVIHLANNFTCGRHFYMGDIVTYAGPYLYPFVVEFSLIAAAVLYAMWSSIGSNPRSVNKLLNVR